MSYTIAQVKENITAMGHGGTLNKVRAFEALCERAANTMIAKVKLLETIRKATLVAIAGTDYDFTLPTDYNGIIDIYPSTVDRTTLDQAVRNSSVAKFDLKKALALKQVVIDGSEGLKIIRIKWENGAPFEIKYYSKLLFRASNSPTAEWMSKPTVNDDDVIIVCDNDSIQIFLLELLKQMAHQLEGTDSAFDISFANSELQALYAPYKAENPNQTKKAVTSYGGKPRFRNI